MKKVLFVAVAAFVGIASAVAGNARTNFFYTNQLNTGTYTLVSSYDVANCSGTVSTLPCEYTSTTSITAPVTQAKLIAAGAVPSSEKKVYIP